MSHRFSINASYTYSHSLDEGSGLAGLFFNGNDPSKPRQAYASSDFDRTHVFTISYIYQLPTIEGASGWVNKVVNGWGVQGVTVAPSGQPFSVIDCAAGSQYFAGDDFIPLLPLAPGISPQKAITGGTDNSFTSGPNQGLSVPYVNPDAFVIPLLSPGQNGVPPCGQTTAGTQECDTFETSFGPIGRNVFRAPFHTRFDFSVVKNFKVSERVALKF
jgi:hypothetical protein